MTHFDLKEQQFYLGIKLILAAFIRDLTLSATTPKLVSKGEG